MGGPLTLSHGDVQAAASLDVLIFVPLALVGGALGVLRIVRGSAPER